MQFTYTTKYCHDDSFFKLTTILSFSVSACITVLDKTFSFIIPYEVFSTVYRKALERMGINLIFYFTWYIVNSLNNLMSTAISGEVMIYPVYVDSITVSGTIGINV